MAPAPLPPPPLPMACETELETNGVLIGWDNTVEGEEGEEEEEDDDEDMRVVGEFCASRGPCRRSTRRRGRLDRHISQNTSTSRLR